MAEEEGDVDEEDVFLAFARHPTPPRGPLRRAMDKAFFIFLVLIVTLLMLEAVCKLLWLLPWAKFEPGAGRGRIPRRTGSSLPAPSSLDHWVLFLLINSLGLSQCPGTACQWGPRFLSSSLGSLLLPLDVHGVWIW